MQQQQQQQQEVLDNKRAFNVLLWFCMAYSRALTVPLRTHFGAEALGFPALWGFALIFLWAGFSGDPCMWGYLGFWFLCLVCRRIGQFRLWRRGVKLHSYYDGFPRVAMWVPFVRKEDTAKLFIEPLLVFGAGVGLSYVYEAYEMQPGLDRFLMYGGGFGLPFVEIVKRLLSRRRVQSMIDARLEQQSMAERLRREMGE